MNTFTLKWIALITMVIDHVGVVFFPQDYIFRMIGRLSFPIFAYLLAEGFYYTHDVKKYLLRLGVFAILSEIPYDVVLRGGIWNWEHQNIFLTMFLGVFTLYLVTRTTQVWKQGLIVAIMLCVTLLVRGDYTWVGLLMILCFYLFRDKPIKKSLSMAGLNFYLGFFVQWCGIFALIPILLHNRKQGPKMKWFFYVCYPAHLIIIYFIQLMI